MVNKDRAVIVNKLNKNENVTTIIPNAFRKSTEFSGIVVLEADD